MSSSLTDSFAQLVGQTHSFDEGYHGPDSFSNFNSTAADPPPPTYASGGEVSTDSASFSSETNANGPILPPPAEIEPEEGYALREWRRQSAIRLEEKEKREKEFLSQIIAEAEEYKVEFHKKRQLASESNGTVNREREKVQGVDAISKAEWRIR